MSSTRPTTIEIRTGTTLLDLTEDLLCISEVGVATDDFRATA
ncbi:hypothetical protein [Cryobacterium sp. GrIS_2_6]|nr:hypothetical protein [Cryobacterium psychrotolerans]